MSAQAANCCSFVLPEIYLMHIKVAGLTRSGCGAYRPGIGLSTPREDQTLLGPRQLVSIIQSFCLSFKVLLVVLWFINVCCACVESLRQCPAQSLDYFPLHKYSGCLQLHNALRSVTGYWLLPKKLYDARVLLHFCDASLSLKQSDHTWHPRSV